MFAHDAERSRAASSGVTTTGWLAIDFSPSVLLFRRYCNLITRC